MYNGNTEVEILVNGKPVKMYSYSGRTYVQANKGSSYTIKIKNSSSERRLFVCSVDGINVIDGTAAGKSRAGYVIDGYSSYEVSGFRTSNDVVNSFKFSDKSDSYAALSDETQGDTSNCGVIGIRVYGEKYRQTITYTPAPIVINPVVFPPYDYKPPIIWNYNNSTTIQQLTSGCAGPSGPVGPAGCGGTSSSSSVPTASYNMSVRSYGAGGQSVGGQLCCASNSYDIPVQDAAFDVGTEFAHELKDKVYDTEFEIGLLLYTFEIYYASRGALEYMGVPVQKKTTVSFPNAFPKGFCKPPRNH